MCKYILVISEDLRHAMYSELFPLLCIDLCTYAGAEDNCERLVIWKR